MKQNAHDYDINLDVLHAITEYKFLLRPFTIREAVKKCFFWEYFLNKGLGGGVVIPKLYVKYW